MKNKCSLFTLWACIVLPCLSSAETVTFQTLAIKDPIENVSFTSQGKKKTFTVPAYSLSEPQTYTGGSVLKFYAKDAPDEPDSTKPKAKDEPLAIATLPENTARVLILFNKQDDKTYKCIVIPDGIADFPAGALRFFNGMPGNVAVSYNHIPPLVLQSGELQLISNQSGNHLTEVAMQTGQGWQIMFTGFVNALPNGRRNIFFMPGSLIRVQSADDIVPRPLEVIFVDSAVPPESHP